MPDGTLFTVGNLAYENAGPFATYRRYSSTGAPLRVGGLLGLGDVLSSEGYNASSLRAAALTPRGRIVAAGWAGSLSETGC